MIATEERHHEHEHDFQCLCSPAVNTETVYLPRHEYIAAAGLERDFTLSQEPGADRRRPGCSRSSSAENDLRALGTVQPAGELHRLAGSGAGLAARHLARTERLAAPRLWWAVPAHRPPPLFSQAIRARCRFAGFAPADQGRAGTGHARSCPGRGATCLLYTSPSPRDGLLSRM